MLSRKNKIKKAVFILGGSIPILLCMLILSFKVFWQRVPKQIKTQIYSLKFMIFWNAPIRALLEMFYPMMCNSLYVFWTYNQQTRQAIITSIVWVSVLTGSCFFVLNFLTKNKNLVEDKDYQQKFGAFYTNIELINKPKAVYYSFIFLLHRIIMAITITCLVKFLVMQVFLMVYINLGLLIWLMLIKPMDTYYKNLLEFIN